MVPTQSTRSRRAVLHGIGATAALTPLAGCSRLGADDDGAIHHPGASQVHVHNDAGERLRTAVTVRRMGDDPTTVVDRSIGLDPGSVVRLPEGENVPLTDDVTVVVDVAGGPRERFEWRDPSAGGAPLHVFLNGDNVLFALQVG